MYTLRILLIFHTKYLVVQAQEKRQVRQILKEKKATLLMLPDLDFCSFCRGKSTRYFVLQF
jgi:hypothetical protein